MGTAQSGAVGSPRGAIEAQPDAAQTTWTTDQPGRYVHPVFKAIAGELELIDGEISLHEERFEFWAKRCWQKYPRNAHPDLYAQLGALAFRLARSRCIGALQLFALASFGLEAAQTQRYLAEDAFLRNDEAQHLRSMARGMAVSATRGAVDSRPQETVAPPQRPSLLASVATGPRAALAALPRAESGVRLRPVHQVTARQQQQRRSALALRHDHSAPSERRHGYDRRRQRVSCLHRDRRSGADRRGTA
jgi:hypothetical protein